MAASTNPDTKLPGENSCIFSTADHTPLPLSLPILAIGEIMVAQAHKARYLLHYTDPCETSVGVAISGTLSCTNYSFHFEPDVTPGQLVRRHVCIDQPETMFETALSPLCPPPPSPPFPPLSLSLSLSNLSPSLPLLPSFPSPSLPTPSPSHVAQKLGRYESFQLASCRHVPLGCVKELYMSKPLLIINI